MFVPAPLRDRCPTVAGFWLVCLVLSKEGEAVGRVLVTRPANP